MIKDEKKVIDYYDVVLDKKVDYSFKSSDTNIIDVDEFPTENIDGEKIYKKNIKTNADIVYCLEGQIESVNSFMTNEYYFVNSLPENPVVSDVNSADPWNIYIMNDIAYIYTSLDGTSNPI